MNRDTIINKYFEWLFGLVCEKRFAREVSYRKLLTSLHNTEFIFSIPMDRNRASDGVNLRYRFAMSQGYDDIPDLIMEYLKGPCSILEMMVALAIRCEEETMDDPTLGDRTGQWFWEMVTNLGLGSMTDKRFDRDFVDDTINIFLNRDYEPDGKGGLFQIRNCKDDMRNVQIWSQLCRYLNSIT